MKPRVYIIHPFTNGDQIANMASAVRWFNYLLTEGSVHPVCCLATAMNCHFQEPRTHAEWMVYDIEELDTCDAALLCNSDTGHTADKSVGCEEEIRRCIQNGIPIFKNVFDLKRWADEGRRVKAVQA